MSRNHDDRRKAAETPDQKCRNREIMLDAMAAVGAAASIEQLWTLLWEALQRRAPAISGLRIFRGDVAVMRQVWVSNPAHAPMNLILQGWGPGLLEMMRGEPHAGAFLEMLGETEEEARARLKRFFQKQGSPLLLDDPGRQLPVLLSADDFQKVKDTYDGGQLPGQVILCPIVVGERIALVAAVTAAPGEKPFSWDDAADVWSLVQLAHEVSGRIEAEEKVVRHDEEIRMLRAVMRRIVSASDVGELVDTAGEVSQEILNASGAVIVGPQEEDPATHRVLWSAGLAEKGAEEIGARLMGFLERQASPRKLIILESVGGGELLGGAGVSTAGVEALTAAPLEVQGELLGVMALMWRSPRRVSADERGILEFLGTELALAMHRYMLVRRLTQFQDELQKIADAVAEGIIVLDGRGRIRYCNTRARELLGMTVAVGEGKPILDVLGEAQRGAVAPLLGRVLSGRSVSQRSLDLGTSRIDVAASVLGNGEIAVGSVWTVLETEKDAARGALSMDVLRHVSDAVLVMDESGSIIEANDAARRFFDTGLISTTTSGGRTSYRWAGGFSDRFMEELRGHGTVRRESSVVGRHGRRIPYEAVFWRVGSTEDVRILAVVRDLTWIEEQVHAERQRRESRRLTRRGMQVLEELEERLGSQKDLVTSLLTQCELAMGTTDDVGKLRATVGTLHDAAERGRASLISCSALVRELAETLEIQGERMGPDEAGTEQVWIVSDRPQRREQMLQIFASAGLHPLTIEGEELATIPEDAGLPGLVVVDLKSLTGIEGIYNRLRRLAPAVPLIVISAVGMIEGASAGPEDPHLHVMTNLPAGPELEDLLDAILNRV